MLKLKWQTFGKERKGDLWHRRHIFQQFLFIAILATENFNTDTFRFPKCVFSLRDQSIFS